MGKLFIWDFHGVLEKDHEYSVVEVTNQVLEEFKVEARLDINLCRKLYGKKWQLFFEKLCPEADEKTIKAMVDRGVELSNTEDTAYKHIKPMEFSHEVLDKIKKAGHENLILSNTEPNVLDKFLNSVNISHLINHKIGADSHRKSPKETNAKIELLKEFLKTKRFDKLISIGDMDTDTELGKSVGAVTYFFSKLRPNEGGNADYKISDLREVLKEL